MAVICLCVVLAAKKRLNQNLYKWLPPRIAIFVISEQLKIAALSNPIKTREDIDL